ncbi:hypothetical protein LCGC14_2874670, partial [marine sediment metagenome]
MEISKQACSLSLSKQLKEAGYKQEGIWWWVRGLDNPCSEIRQPREIIQLCLEEQISLDFSKVLEKCVAPTVAELGERLPNRCKTRWFTEQVSGLSSWVIRLWDCDADGKA